MFRFWQSVLSSLLKLPVVAAVGILVTLSAISAPVVFAQTLTTLHDFSAGHDGANPFGGLTADAAGNLYGATIYGGTAGRGTVFQFTPPATSGGSWTETILYSFQGGADGDEPYGPIATDKNGNLYGVTAMGGNQDSICGSGGCGTVFELSPPAVQGGSWTETVLYRFSPSSGFTPSGGLVPDGDNTLYGTTANGGPTKNGGGTIFKLTRVGGNWTEATIYTFAYWGLAGDAPGGPLIRDSAGRLYGVASGNGGNFGGTVFQLAPPTKSGGKWTLSILLSFGNGSNAGTGGAAPLVMGGDGSIYGEAFSGGSGGAGTVFRLTPPTTSGGSWTQTILYSFQSSANNGNPSGGLTLDRNSHVLYGTTTAGYGTVFQLRPPTRAGGQWTYSILHSFTNGSDGWAPYSVFHGSSGDLFGATVWGGSSQFGTLFEVTP